mmetsp:Transcript_111946/g.321644  ORF Transcript_111946/g.321644 Transcript_111946/m.321644 type:complete len:215 (-) Transcript_111946:856-1500(-)
MASASRAHQPGGSCPVVPSAAAARGCATVGARRMRPPPRRCPRRARDSHPPQCASAFRRRRPLLHRRRRLAHCLAHRSPPRGHPCRRQARRWPFRISQCLRSVFRRAAVARGTRVPAVRGPSPVGRPPGRIGARAPSHRTRPWAARRLAPSAAQARHKVPHSARVSACSCRSRRRRRRRRAPPGRLCRRHRRSLPSALRCDHARGRSTGRCRTT